MVRSDLWTVFPRQQCRGLIEAPLPESMPMVLQVKFPRQQCRGLIEAQRTDDLIQRPGRGFRGSNAAASLKLPGHPVACRHAVAVSAAAMPRPH